MEATKQGAIKRNIASIAFSMIALGGPSVAIVLAHVDQASAGIVGVGTIGSCDLTGAFRTRPALVFGGTSTGVTARFRGELTNCSGGTGDGANIISGKLRGRARFALPANDCMMLMSVPLQPFHLKVRWKSLVGTPRLVPSTVHIGGGFFYPVGPNGSVQMMLLGPSQDGSFLDDTLTTVGITDQTMADFASDCDASPPRRLTLLTFTGLNGTSSIHD